MKRLITLFALLFLLAYAPDGLAASQKEVAPEENISLGPVSLRENISVSGSYIRLSDFFNNAPADKANTAVAYSPKPGRKASFDARWLYRVAHAYGLKWRPLSADLNALVTRESIIIQTSEIKDALLEALNNYDLPENSLIELSDRNMNIHVSTDTNPEIHVENMTYNTRSQRFAALVSVGEKSSGANQRVRVSGQILEMINIPTLNHRISKGDVIKEQDITWIKQRADRTQRDIIVQADDIIGMTPKRHLRPDTPIRTSDIQRPILVSKGSLVTIVLKQTGLSLTSQGRSLDSGADGDTIRINNTHSNRTIEAIVIGENIVTVSPTGLANPQVAYNR